MERVTEQRLAQPQATPLEHKVVVWGPTGSDLVRVPAGTFRYGRPQDWVDLPEFWIGRTSVTNAEYARFLQVHPEYPVPFVKADWARPYNWDAHTRLYPSGLDNHPVTLVSWYDAVAYTEWAGARLPSDKEWEKAARGIDGRAYPWGCWELDRCNTYEAGIGATTPVGAYSPVGDSPYGCVDMAGNVWEWTATHDGLGLVVRGGSFVNERHQAACTFRDWDLPESGLRLYGFRIAVSSLEAAMG